MNQATPATAAAQAAAARKAERQVALEAAKVVIDGLDRSELHPVEEAFIALYEAFAPKAKPSAGPRERLEMMDPAEVKAYFDSTGLTRKQIAGAANVSASVIATVQNTNKREDGSYVGDQWSVKTFEVKRALIDKYVEEHADEIAAAKAADLAAAQAKQAEADAKAARKAAREQAKAAAAAAPKPAPKAKAAPAAQAAPAASAPKPTTKNAPGAKPKNKGVVAHV